MGETTQTAPAEVLPPAPTNQVYAIVHDSVDALSYQIARSETRGFGHGWKDATGADHEARESEDGKRILRSMPTWPELQQDLWLSLYRKTPRVRDLAEMAPATKFNGLVMGEVTKLAPYRDLHAQTYGSDLKTSEALAILVGLAEKWLDDLKKRLRRATKASGSGGVPLPWGGEASEQAIENAARQSAREVLKEISEELEQIEGCLSAAGVGTGAEMQVGDAQKRIAIGRKLMKSAQFTKLAQMVGRMQMAARAIRQSTIDPGHAEVTDIECGCSIPQLLPAELVALGDETFELAFLRRLSERQVLQYKLRSPEELNRGPMVICVDSSGSMGGDKDVWAKAVALALTGVCREQKRDCCVLFYDDRVKREISLPGGKVSLEEFELLATFFSGGGTNFSMPLERARKIIETGAEKMPKMDRADIVFITDGQAHLDDFWVKRFCADKARLSFHIWGVGIQCGSSAALTAVCDEVCQVANLNDDKQALDVVFGRATK